jgi:hypothetical protein
MLTLQSAMWFQAVKGVSVVLSGALILLPVGIPYAFCAFVVGPWLPISRRVHVLSRGSTLRFLASWVFMGIGSGMLTRLKPDNRGTLWVLPQVICGLGAGLTVPLKHYQALFSRHLPVNTRISRTSSKLCQAVGIALAHAIFVSHFRNSLPQDVAISSTITTANNSTMTTEQETLLAYNEALISTFWVPTAASGLAAILVVLLYFPRVLLTLLEAFFRI